LFVELPRTVARGAATVPPMKSPSALAALAALAPALALGATLAAACSSSNGNPAAATDAGATDAAVVDTGTAADAAHAGDGSADGGIVSVQILAFNDFHGNLRPPDPTNSPVLVPPGDPAINDAGTPEPGNGGNTIVHAGGAAYLAAHLNALRANNPNTLVVSAGDLTGASQLVSAVYDDEPTVDVMNAMGLDVHGVGNHEFDRGLPTLLRYKAGGCDPSDQDGGYGSCEVAPLPFPGAKFDYLAANVDYADGGTSDTIFPPYLVKTVAGAKIAFIGVTLTDLSPYDADGIVGLTFPSEFTTTNALVATLKSQVDAIVVLIHEGGSQEGTYDACDKPSSEITTIAQAIDPAVTAIHTAHTHAAYNCTIGGRPVTSAAAFGRLITQFELSIDTVHHKVLSTTAKNVVVTRDVTPDPTVLGLVNGYVADVAPLGGRQVGQITADIVDATGENGESPVGDVLCDGMLAYASAQGHPADVAFLNVGGIRDSLYYESLYGEPLGDVTYEKAFNVIPFADTVETLQCKGSDILAALQQNEYPGQLFQVSSTFTYSWAKGSGVDTSSVRVGGAPIVATNTYTVATVTFVAQGGDGYTAFENCTNPTPIGVDIDAFTQYLTAHESPPLAPPAANRITKN
jgi:5'-nucleotidase